MIIQTELQPSDSKFAGARGRGRGALHDGKVSRTDSLPRGGFTPSGRLKLDAVTRIIITSQRTGRREYTCIYMRMRIHFARIELGRAIRFLSAPAVFHLLVHVWGSSLLLAYI